MSNRSWAVSTGACSAARKPAAILGDSRRGLRNLIAALADVTADYRDAWGAALGAGRALHRPGVLFPYLDNDIGSYPHLDEYLRLAYEELGCRVRLATVGFSSGNHHLVQMHERIATTLAHPLAAVRFSWTSYTMGWTGQGQQQGETSRAQFISDFGSMLRTYRPVVEKIGANKESGCCVELRFAPLAVTSRQNLLDDTINAHHVVSAGPHLLVSQHIAGLIPTPPARTRRVQLFRFTNADRFTSAGRSWLCDPSTGNGLSPDLAVGLYPPQHPELSRQRRLPPRPEQRAGLATTRCNSLERRLRS
jgi:hypothetical protein